METGRSQVSDSEQDRGSRTMIELKDDELVFRFPEVHESAKLRVGFQRTLRIPDDNRAYPLPLGFGTFPLNHVDDYADRVPEAWRRHGGVFLPMHQAEAMWINFRTSYPMAVKVAAGKIDALTGKQWKNDLSSRPQDYLVVPDQPWLDGFCVGKGMIRQFVAMALGEGYTAEEQLTGEAQHGGLQIIVYAMKASKFQELQRESEVTHAGPVLEAQAPMSEMGLAPGGRMRQKVFEDEYGLDAWCTSVRARCFVHVLNSLQFFAVSGVEPPQDPPTAKEYATAGLPWFDYYGGDLTALEGSKKLLDLDSVAVMNLKKGKGSLAGNDPVQPMFVKRLNGDRVREGEF